MNRKILYIQLSFVLFFSMSGLAQNPDNVIQFNTEKYEILDTAVFQIVYQFDFIEDVEKKTFIQTI